MKLLVLTQEYPADDLAKEFTPVVHFFAKEWVKGGHEVLVVNMPSNFPGCMYAVARPFRRRIESLLGTNIRMYVISRREYMLDGVKVLRFPLRKIKPHGRFPDSELRKASSAVLSFCQQNSFSPDVIVGHWTNPSVDMLLSLKRIYHVPTALVLHDGGNDFLSIYKDERADILENIDIIGYRSFPIKKAFERQFGIPPKSFMCFSGVPEEYLANGVDRSFGRIRDFLYVGLLIRRKHPLELVMALDESGMDDFTLNIIGEGDVRRGIENYVASGTCRQGKVNLLGRLPRNEVSGYMKKADVFCMISEGEAFGLVYIEAMAAGCITIASRDEGFDGIIIDGENGFLCEAGNTHELAGIINRINNLPPEELSRISTNAIRTASRMTDKAVAEDYLKNIQSFI